MSFKLGEVIVEPGKKRKGFLQVAEKPIGKVKVPFTVLNGKNPGPTLCVTAGIHGAEYPGIKAAQILAQETKPSNLNGTLIIIHCVNVPGFEARTAFVNPIDDLNLNRIFPGQPQATSFYGGGSISHHIANGVYTRAIKKSTHYIDLHSGDLPEMVPHLAFAAMTGDKKKDEEIEAMLKYSLADFVRLSPYKETLGGLQTTTATASREKIPHVALEAGEAGLLRQDAVSKHVDAVRNIMRYLGMIEGKPIEPLNQQHLGSSVGIRSKRGGFFTYLVKPGEIVQKGQKIGVITDIFGETIEEITTPIEGCILLLNFIAAKNTGDSLFSISKIIS